MSSLMYGAITRKREEAPAGQSTDDKPPGLQTYVDALAALIPAEVLSAHAVVISNVTTTKDGATSITAPAQLAFFFWFFVALSIALFLIGRRAIPRGWDWVRMFIPSLAFLGWTMLQPTTAFDAVAPDFSPDWRWALGLALAIVLGIVAAVLGGVADKKEPTPGT